MNDKTRDFIAVFIIQLVLTLPFYTASAYGLAISNAKVAKVSSTSATIEWSTDNASNGRVRYGKTASLGFTQRHDNFIDNHSITIFNGIDSDTSYFFVVESTDLAGSSAIDNNSNNFYTFKTTDITPPPQVTGLRVVSTASNSIAIAWDAANITDFSHFIIYKDRLPVANSTAGRFNDTNLETSKEHSYKVSAVDKSGNEGQQSDTLIASTSGIDSAAPIISGVDVLGITDTTARVTWLTNENATTVVFYGTNKTDKTKSSNDMGTNHTIVIDGLVKSAQVLLVVKSCDSSGNCANSSQNFTAGKDTKIPFINLSIPRCVNRRVIDIAGSTEQFSAVSLFVNNMNVPKRSLSSNEVGASGKFVFSQIQLEKNNVVKLVMVDKSGNKNQKIFETRVDTEDPIVQLKETPLITSSANFTFIGTVNEPVAIKIFVDANVNESSVPQKITGLNATKIGKNSVELKWNEAKGNDFSHYVVYRSDIGAIALTKPSNFNLFIDALVDSGKSYTYQVSAVNTLGKEGPKSDEATVTTEKGGAILNLNPPLVDPLEDFRKPVLIHNASGSFSFGVSLGRNDGAYKIKAVIEDCAENSVIIQKDVVLDTKKPEVKITSPASGAFIFENVANQIDIEGKTKPNARVHLFVDRTPFSLFNNSFEISGLPNEVQNLPEAQLDAKCRSSVSTSFCRTGADFSVDADSNGNFRFEDVDLTVIFGGAARLTEVTPTEFRDVFLNPENQESKRVTLVVIATDQTGQRGTATQAVRIGTCWSGNQSWDIIPLTQYQSPPAGLSTERLRDGTETIYFYFNYSYIGRGTNAKIDSITLSKACSARETLDSRFNISCKIMPGGGSAKPLNPPENTVSYSAIQLGRFPGMDRFLENDWKSFFKAINKELTFPFKVTISYKHDTDNDGELETEKQTTCEQVTYTVDDTIIDPRKVLPDWLLFDFVDFLQESIGTLTAVQEQVGKVLEYLAIACFSSMGINLAVQIYRRWVTFWDEKLYAVSKNDAFEKALAAFKLAQGTGGTQEECTKLMRDIRTKKGSFRLKYVNDIDLNKCFPGSAKAWDTEAKTYSLLRWSCDRVFGHASPSGWTESKDDGQLLAKIQSGEGCAVDQSVRGQPLRLIKCKDAQLPKYGAKQDEFGLDDKCLELSEKGDTTLYTLGEQVGNSKIYTLNYLKSEKRLRTAGSIYAIRKDENNFLTAQSQSCAELCGVKDNFNQQQVLYGETSKKAAIVLAKDPKSKSTSEVGYVCTTVDNCRSFNQNEKIIDSGGKVHPIVNAFTIGYASRIKKTPAADENTNPPCFYSIGKSESVVSDSPATREECCCINAKKTDVTTNYYHYKDVDMVTGKPVHESKKLSALDVSYAGPESYADMKWSYRYWKEKFEAQIISTTYEEVAQPTITPSGTEISRISRNPVTETTTHREYHPKRYIEGRDKSACFGQNHLFYDGFNTKDEKVLAVDPFKDHWAAFQCVNVGGINNRIQFLKNLMNSLKTCLVQVRTTGRGDSGACKELFTQYLCGALWQVIRSFVDGCIPGFGVKLDFGDEDFLENIKAVAGGVYQSVNDVQNSVTQEYGNAKLNELLGTGEESVARKICLAAFGYDWEFNFKNFVDAAYAQPFATLVQPITKSREFLTVDPQSFRPKYEYKASWVINPGCDFEAYDVRLACVGRKQLDKYPNNVNCGALGAPSIAYTGALGTSTGYSQCDCISQPDEKLGPLLFSGRLKLNALEDRAVNPPKIVEDNYRYDHLKFVLRADRKIPANIKPNCFPTGYGEGEFYFPLTDKSPRDIFDCRVDISTGSLICGEGKTFATRKGVAYFTDVKLADGSDPFKGVTVQSGNALDLTATVQKIGKDKCLKATLDNVIVDIVGIKFDGVNQYQVRTPVLSVTQKETVEKPPFIEVLIKELKANQEPFSIDFTFYDVDKNGYIDFSGKDSKDKANIDNKGIDIIRNYLDNEGKLTIEKNGAKIQIVSVTIPRDNSGNPLFKLVTLEGVVDVGVAQGTIRINKPEQVNLNLAAQTKRLTLALFNIKDGSEAFNDPSDCNFGDAVYYPDKPQERRISITIEQSLPKDALAQAVNTLITPDRVKKGQVQPAELSVRFLNPFSIDNVLYSYTLPDGTQGIANLDRKEQNVFKGTFSTDNLKFAGEVKGKFIITTKEGKTSEKDAKLEVVCGGEDNVYGLCTNEGKCCKDRKCGSESEVIAKGLPCFPKKDAVQQSTSNQNPSTPTINEFPASGKPSGNEGESPLKTLT